MDLFTESSLSDSVIFHSLNKQAELVTIMNNCIKNGKVLTEDYIEEQIYQIKRTRISPLSDDVLEAYQKGKIVLLYAKVVKVPQAIPFTVFRVQGSLKAFVFLNNYGTLAQNTKTGGQEYLNIPMKDLYALMEGAYTALSYYTNPVNIKRNLGLMKLSASIYTSMILRILNREYALTVDQDVFNNTSFAISKFFLSTVWESKNDDINTTYSMTQLIGASKTSLMLTNDSYNQSNITNIEEFIAFLKTLSPRMENLNMRYFTQCYLNLFKSTAIFSMECLPYFLFVVQSSLLGSFLVNQPILNDIFKTTKGINTFYAELSKVI